MPNRAYKLLRLGLICGALLLLLLGSAAARLTSSFLDANRWVRHTTDVMAQVRSTRALLGIALTERPISEKRQNFEAIQKQIDRVDTLTDDNERQQKNIADLREQIARPPVGNQPTWVLTPSVVEGANTILDRMEREENGLLLVRSSLESDAMRNAGIAILGLCVALAVLGLLTAVIARREYQRRERVEAVLKREKKELTRYTEELALVASGSETIQGIQDEGQLARTVAEVLRKLLPGSSGYFGLIYAENQVEIAEAWGDTGVVENFAASECIALRTGRRMHARIAGRLSICGHSRSSAGDALCVPVRGTSGNLGMVHVETAEKVPRRCADSVSLFAAHIALGLTNLRVREDLRHQSTRDSLTGLFNRRYFDEMLQGEFIAAHRGGFPLSLLLMDLDYFKRTNDTFGHAAGDDALRALAGILSASFRESDVVCRYGGEEFAVILRNADVSDAYVRAESFRKLVEEAELGEHLQNLGRITTSIGLAWSTDALTAADLIHAADTALYQAKHTGRNRTCACLSGHTDLPADAVCPIASQSAPHEQHSGHPAFTPGLA